MAVTYTWTINEMFAYPQAEGYQDVVFGVAYTVAGVDGEYTASQSYQIPMPLPEGTFTPYSELTQDQVVGWVQGQLGPVGVSAAESQIAQMISEQQSPTVVTPPLPWASSGDAVQ